MNPQEYFNQTERHDGQQPQKNEQELIEAAKSFSQLTQQVLRENSDEVKAFKSGEATEFSVLIKRHEIDPSNYLSVGVHKWFNKQLDPNSPFKPSETILGDITIQQINNGRGRELLSYRLNADGIVRRWNGGDAYAKSASTRTTELEDEDYFSEGGLNDSVEARRNQRKIQEVARAMNDMMEVDLPIARIEEDLGYQNQPVGVEEMARLAELVNER